MKFGASFFTSLGLLLALPLMAPAAHAKRVERQALCTAFDSSWAVKKVSFVEHTLTGDFNVTIELPNLAELPCEIRTLEVSKRKTIKPDFSVAATLPYIRVENALTGALVQEIYTDKVSFDFSIAVPETQAPRYVVRSPFLGIRSWTIEPTEKRLFVNEPDFTRQAITTLFILF